MSEGDPVQKQLRAAQTEVRQLKETINALRDELECRN